MYNIKYKYCNNFFEISPRAKERSGEDNRRMRGLLETIGVRKVKDSFSKKMARENRYFAEHELLIAS